MNALLGLLVLLSIPSPAVVPVEPTLKYAYGRVERLADDKLVIVTVIGSVSFIVDAPVLIGKDGERHDPSQLGSLAPPSTIVSVWYAFEPAGPRVREIRLEGSPEEDWCPYAGTCFAAQRGAP